jgi:hypothetical protein
MNTEVKARWVAALRSGRYQQGRSALCTITPEGKKYCCLGVLCEELGIPWKPIGGVLHYGQQKRSGTLPPEALILAGLGTSDPFVSYGDRHAVCLSELNDGLVERGEKGKGLSFLEIADLIEQKF